VSRTSPVIWFEDLRRADVPRVGGKNASLGEMIANLSMRGVRVRGEAAVLDACRRCYASLFTDRAIVYRRAKGYDDAKVALSVGVQTMVRSDLGEPVSCLPCGQAPSDHPEFAAFLVRCGIG
jgi:phosphoenolpyruvate synthase/pyruvate phosphate dikinase